MAQCRADVVPSSTTLAQHQPNIGPTPRVCWVCAVAALEIEEEERKREESSAKTITSKKEEKSERLVKRRVLLGHNKTLLHELEEDITSFKNDLRMDPDTFNEILERITPRIKKLTNNYTEPIPKRLRLSVTYNKRCFILLILKIAGRMTGTGIVRFIFIRNCRSRILGLIILLLFLLDLTG